MSDLDVQIPTTFGMFTKSGCMQFWTVIPGFVFCLECFQQLNFREAYIYRGIHCIGNSVSFALDPFADASADDSGAGSKEYVHIRIQQRNGRKSLTTVQGLKKEFSYNKILKDLKREFCCNGTVVQDPELGQVLHHGLSFG
ncbi:hypothetical protein GW17_00005903 [Ensete ventricosum]|nr:hypothetical protein GW17_00005903 [Ensete ventricosum]RZS05781.1 hypothetical protein BHM03_00036335 [Ensete ventricosum]